MRFVIPFLAALLAAIPCHAREIMIPGTGDGLEILHAIAADYTARHPETKITVPPSTGSGGGIAALGSGTADIARIARPLKNSEERNGLAVRPLFRLPSAIYVHPQLSVSGLTSKQLAWIYSGIIKNWSEVGGPDLKIRVVRREDSDSTLSVLRATMPRWKDLKLTARSKIAVTTQDAQETVARVEGAIGFGPYSKALEERVKVLSIDSLFPTDANYPSAVTISYAYRRRDYQGTVRDIVEHARSRSVQDMLVDFGAVPVTDGF